MSSTLARVTLAVAAFASIATSVAFPSVVETQPLDPSVLDDQMLVQTYALRIRHVDAPGADPSGQITVRLELRGGSGRATPELQITLGRDDQVDLRSVLVAPNATQTVDLSLPAWETCDTAATECIEDYTLSITRAAIVDGPAIEVAGTVEVESIHDGKEADPTITIDVIPL
jgi:hypothetical protein